MFKKKQQNKRYIDDLVGQKNLDKLKKEDEKRREKAFVYTGINLDQPHKKCYNCARCLNLYPLKRLNKRRKVKI